MIKNDFIFVFRLKYKIKSNSEFKVAGIKYRHPHKQTMNQAQTLSKRDIACLLEETGYPSKRSWSIRKLKNELRWRRRFIQDCDKVFTGSIWEIIANVPAFWQGFKDFHAMCLMARTCKAFARSIPVNTVAWETISKSLPLMSNRILSEIYKVPNYVLTKNSTLHYNGTLSIAASTALQIAHFMHGGASGLFRKRQAVRLDRESRDKTRKFSWPRELMFQRLIPFLLALVVEQLNTTCCLCGITMYHSYIWQRLNMFANKHLQTTISSSMVYHLMHHVNQYKNIVSKSWNGQALQWTIKPEKFFAEHYPYSQHKLLRNMYAAHFYGQRPGQERFAEALPTCSQSAHVRFFGDDQCTWS